MWFAGEDYVGDNRMRNQGHLGLGRCKKGVNKFSAHLNPLRLIMVVASWYWREVYNLWFAGEDYMWVTKREQFT